MPPNEEVSLKEFIEEKFSNAELLRREQFKGLEAKFDNHLQTHNSDTTNWLKHAAKDEAFEARTLNAEKDHDEKLNKLIIVVEKLSTVVSEGNKKLVSWKQLVSFCLAISSLYLGVLWYVYRQELKTEQELVILNTKLDPLTYEEIPDNKK